MGDIVYQVLDQRGRAISSAAMIPQEMSLADSWNGSPPIDVLPYWQVCAIMGGTSPITAGRTFTDANGTFEDALIGYSNSLSSSIHLCPAY